MLAWTHENASETHPAVWDYAVVKENLLKDDNSGTGKRLRLGKLRGLKETKCFIRSRPRRLLYWTPSFRCILKILTAFSFDRACIAFKAEADHETIYAMPIAWSPLEIS